jgi:hypothetical protein
MCPQPQGARRSQCGELIDRIAAGVPIRELGLAGFFVFRTERPGEAWGFRARGCRAEMHRLLTAIRDPSAHVVIAWCRFMTWFGIGHFVSALSFCFFPAAPAFWLVGHFVGGGRILFGIWLLMFAWFVRISWRMARRREADR